MVTNVANPDAEALSDACAREAIATQFHKSLFVEAGAGSGKTTALSNRLCQALIRGVATVDEIVAVTFTKAAAAELKDRIRRTLFAMRDDERISLDEQHRIDSALEGLNSAAIQTIHAFAERIVRTYGFHLGIPPGFEVIDATTARRVLLGQWRKYLDELAMTPTFREVARLSGAFGLEFRRVFPFVEFMSAHVAIRGDTRSTTAPRITLADTMMLRTVAREATQLMAQGRACMDQTDALYLTIERISSWGEEVTAQLDEWADEQVSVERPDVIHYAETIRLALSFPQLRRGRIGKKSNWTVPIDDVREGVATCVAALDEMITPVAQSLYKRWEYHLTEAATRYRRAALAMGVMDFDDVIARCRELVRMDAVCKELRGRYKMICIDEFQDTDALQVDIAVALSHSDTSKSDEMVGKQLFVVGDPKQSIYRFRGADLGQFHKVRSVWPDDPTVLNTNFRSLPNIVTWVNATFDSLMKEAGVPFTPLAVGRRVDGAEGSVQVLGETVAEMSAAKLRQTEAEDVVRRIADGLKAGWAIHDESGARPVRLRDIAILVPSRTMLPALERALVGGGIPYSVESRSMVWRTDDVHNVLCALRAIANPYDDVAIVGALRSPLFGITDDELVAWRAGGGSWRYLAEIPTLLTNHPVADAFAYLRECWRQRHSLSPAEMCSKIVDERGVNLFPFARPRQREGWNRIRFLLEQCRRWTTEVGGTLSDMLEWIEMRESQGSDDREAPVAESDDDAVRVMTIHAAKGLEFPVAVVMGLTLLTSPRKPSRCAHNGVAYMEFSDRVLHSEIADVQERSKEDELAEQMRLLYVACTRARDHLLVSMWRPEKRSARAVTLLSTHVASDGVCEPMVMGSAVTGTPANAVMTEQRVVESHDVPRDVRRESILEVGARPVWLTATTLARVEADQSWASRRVRFGEEIDEWSYDTEDMGDLARHRGFGLAVHAVLEQVIRWDSFRNESVDDESLWRLCSLAVVEQGVESLAQRCLYCVRLALGADVMKRAAHSNRTFAEMPLAYVPEYSDRVDSRVEDHKADLVIGGVADLVFEESGVLHVVDYKTEMVTGSSVEVAAKRYAPQLVAYAGALKHATGLEVGSATLLFVSPRASEPMEWPVDISDVDRSLASVVERVRHVVTTSVASDV